MTLGLAVPLYDEEALVEGVARRICAALGDRPYVLALVDNGSGDRTGERIARLAAVEPRILPVYLESNAGYGGGILAGIAAAREVACLSVVGWAWGDDQVDPAVLPRLLAHVEAGAHLAKARRVAREDGRRRAAISRAYALCLRGRGVQLPDVNGCPKLLSVDAFDVLSPRSRDWFLDAEVVLGCLKRGWEVADEPVVMRPRGAGKSKVRARTLVEFAVNLARWSGNRST